MYGRDITISINLKIIMYNSRKTLSSGSTTDWLVLLVPEYLIGMLNQPPGNYYITGGRVHLTSNPISFRSASSVRDQLHTIVYRYPPTASLTSEEQDLVWKFRFYLSSHKKALTKFLKCINWETGSEVRQALSLLSQWVPMDVEDALELLSPTFKHPVVRRYAISRLKQAPDDDLVLYLLQLVQALKYENFNDIEVSANLLLNGQWEVQSFIFISGSIQEGGGGQ